MTTYSISLDNVDLALLPLRTYKYNDFLKKEYYQFEVMRTEAAEEPVETILYTCYICAIEVPAAFANEHTASIKHQANARIASVAMKRMSSGIFCPPPPNTKRSSAHFCANCATVAKENHGNTKEHRVAVMHDNLLWDLMKAYVHDDDEFDQNLFHTSKENGLHSKEDKVNHKDIVKDDDSISTSIHSQADMKKKKRKAKKKGTDKSVTINLENNDWTSTWKDEDGIDFGTWENTSSNAKESELNTSTSQGIISSVNETKKEVPIINYRESKSVHENKTDQQSQIDYVLPTTSRAFPGPTKVEDSNILSKIDAEDLSTSHNSHNSQHSALRSALGCTDSKKQFELKESNRRIYLKINDNLLNVDNDHYHSYQRDNNGDVKCIVCDCDLEREEAEVHKYYMIHTSMNRVSNVGNDDHYVREVNEVYSHCILCNKKVVNNAVAKHKRAKYHVLRKQIMTKNDNDIKQVSETEQNYHQNKVISKNNTISAFEFPIETKMADDELYETKIEYPFEECLDKGSIYCLFCDCKLPRDMNNRNLHIKGSKHSKHLKNMSVKDEIVEKNE